MSVSEEKNPFEKIKEDFPVFTFENKTGVPKFILLNDGHDVQVNGGATAKVNSKDLNQLPDFTVFRCVEPSTSTLIKYGVIGNSKKKEDKKPEPTKSEPTKPTENK